MCQWKICSRCIEEGERSGIREEKGTRARTSRSDAPSHVRAPRTGGWGGLCESTMGQRLLSRCWGWAHARTRTHKRGVAPRCAVVFARARPVVFARARTTSHDAERRARACGSVGRRLRRRVKKSKLSPRSCGLRVFIRRWGVVDHRPPSRKTVFVICLFVTASVCFAARGR